MAKDNWTKQSASKVYHCRKCSKKIEIGEECYTLFHIHATHDIIECIECREIKVKEEFENLSTECLQKSFNLGLKAHAPNNLTTTDYWDIKNLQTELEEASKKQELADPLIKEEIRRLQRQFQDIEIKFPKHIKLKADWPKNKNCPHKNVYWKLDEIAYCLDCGEDENREFLSRLCLFCQKKVDDWVDKHNLNQSREVLKATSEFYQVFTTQSQFKNTYQQVVQELNQLAKSKGITDLLEEINPNDREREREREQIRKKIKRLEQKTNRTPEEETELENLRSKLRELENNHEEKPVNYLPWIIGGSVLVVGIIVVVLILNKRNKRRYY